jgi:exopolysaccharide production protein ExoZ
MYGHEVDGSNFIRSLFFEPRLKDGAFFPVVIQGWTLTYEMFFYVVFAAALIAPEGRRLYIVSGVLGVLCVLCLLYPVASGYARALGNPIILEFLGGMLLGKLWMSDLKPPLWLGLAILLTGFILLGISESLMPELPRFVRWGGPALMIVAGGIFSERAYSSLSLYPLKIIGDASYSIYLWHVVVVSFLDGVLLRFKLNTILHIALIGILTVAITTLLYFVLEKPIINLLRASKSREVPI